MKWIEFIVQILIVCGIMWLFLKYLETMWKISELRIGDKVEKLTGNLQEYLEKKHDLDQNIYKAQLELGENFLKYLKHIAKQSSSEVPDTEEHTEDIVDAMAAELDRVGVVEASYRFVKRLCPGFTSMDEGARDLAIRLGVDPNRVVNDTVKRLYEFRKPRTLKPGRTVKIEIDKDITTREIVATIVEKNASSYALGGESREELGEVRHTWEPSKNGDPHTNDKALLKKVHVKLQEIYGDNIRLGDFTLEMISIEGSRG